MMRTKRSRMNPGGFLQNMTDDSEMQSQQTIGVPVTDYDSKTVMLRAERGDKIAVEDYGMMTVAKRTQPYFGPRLILYDEESDQNWQLTSPGPASQLQIWESVTDEDGFREGWRKAAEVTAELVETKQYDICACGEPVKTQEHARMAYLGIGEHG